MAFLSDRYIKYYSNDIRDSQTVPILSLPITVLGKWKFETTNMKF